LRGKNKALFTTHEDAGDFVVVINAEKIRLTGKKWSDKLYRDHSLFPGGLKELSAEKMVERHPTELVKRAVWGMLPKGPLGRRIYKKLKVYAGTEHPHAAQQPKPLALS
jgi:large subunit ribosomal protein L13